MPDIYAGSHDTDFTPPRVENPTPSSGSSGHAVDIPVGYDLVDDTFYGPDLNNTTFRLNGEVAYTAGAWQSGYGGIVAVLSNGFQFITTSHPDFTGLVFAQVDSQDTAPIPNIMTSYVWTFSVSFRTISKAFLFNTLASKASGASSYFQPKISDIAAGSKGNTAMAARATSAVGVGSAYELRTVQAGRFDVDLDYIRESTEELGTGQITYDEIRNFRGSYSPPAFLVDNGVDVFGMETTFTKGIFSRNASQRFSSIVMCDRDDDSFFVFVTRHSFTITEVYSVPKIGRTDSNVVNGVAVSDMEISCATKIADGRYLLVYARDSGVVSGIDAQLRLKIIDATGAVIETPNVFAPIRRNEITSAGYKGADIISRDNVLYIVFSYGSDVSTISTFRTYFAKSIDSGKTWEMINGPGTNKLALVPTTIFDELKASTYVGQLWPKVSWDYVEEKFLLSFMGYRTTPGYRTVTCQSDNFAVWTRLNFPVFKDGSVSGATGYQVDLDQKTLGVNNLNRIVRHGGILFGVASDDDGQYICRFMNDDSLNGTRRGMFWCEDPTAASPPVGAIINDGDLKNIDNIVYLATIIEPSGSSGTEGFSVHAYGVLTNLPDKTVYSNAYFGVVSKPSDDFGWPEYTTGSPSITNTNNGLRILGASTEQAYYHRQDIPYPGGLGGDADGGLKIKVHITPIQDGGLGSVNTQRIRVSIPTTVSTEVCDFEVQISTAGIRLHDLIAPSNVDYIATIGEIEILIVYLPNSTTTANVRVYTNIPGNTHDEWISRIDTTIVSNTDTTRFIRFGLSTVATGTSEAYWKALFYSDRVDNTDYSITDFTDGLESYNASTDESELIPIPMAGEETYQPIVDGIEVKWRGTDAYEGDDWNFDVDTNFSADNALSKNPDMIWRSGVNTASGLGTMTDEYIEFDADVDDFGMFVFDTFVVLGTNFRLAKLQANNDGTSWSPATYEQDIDLEIETGTTTSGTVGRRVEYDLMTVIDSAKNWIIGEFVGKYIEIEELYEFGISGAPTNIYKNTAFKILENGTNYIVVSTKGLAVDELGTGGSKAAIYVQIGKSYSIYDTRISAITDAIQAYRYIRLTIPASKSYTDAWTTSNQPNLPNERSWALGEFDIGVRIELQDDADYGYITTHDSKATIQRQDNGAMVVNKRGVPSRAFKLSYSLLEDYDHEILEALYEAISESDKPFWYAPYIEEQPRNVYLVNLPGEHASRKFLPEHQADDIVLEEVV